MENNKKSKIFKLILLIIVLIILYITIRSTYSKYITAQDSSTSSHISNWNIKLNDEDIRNKKDFSGDVRLVKDTNENISENVIAPTSSGTFTVTLESTGTELPYDYDFEFADSVKYDYDSSYTTKLNGTPWESNGTYTYPVEFNLDYSYLDTPIWYYYNNEASPWNSGFEYNEKEIEIVLPAGFSCEPSYLGNCKSYSIEGNIIKFVPQWYSWNKSSSSEKIYPNSLFPTYCSTNYSDNTLTQYLHLTYTKKLDVNWDEFWESVSTDGTQIKKKNLADFKVTKYQINDSEPIEVSEDEFSIKGSVKPEPSDVEVKFVFKFYVEWYDKDDNVLNNEEDVTISKSTDNIYGTIPLNLSVTQSTGN